MSRSHRTTRPRRTARTALALFSAGLLALGAASCGDDDSGGSGGTDDKATEGGGSGVQLPKLDGTTLTVGAVWTGTEQDNFKKVLDEFSKRTGATVNFVPTGDNVAGFVATQVAGGKAPDIVMVPQVGVLAEFVQKGWAKPMAAETQAQMTKNYAQAWQDLGAVDGKQYGVYWKAASKSLIWYNSAAFEGAGVEEPKTWDEFVSTAQTIADSGVPPVSVGGANGWTLTDWFENVYLSQAGPEMYDKLAKHEIKWTDPSVKSALDSLAQLWGNDDLLAGGKAGALKTEFPDSMKMPFTDLENPKAAMAYEGDFSAASISETKAEIGTDAKVFPFPAVGDESPVVTAGDAAVVLNDNKGAHALQTWFASTEAATLMAQQGGYTSPNKTVKSDAYPNDVQRTIAEAVIAAGDDFRFDMSDQAPAAFGGTDGAGEWKALQDFLAKPDDVAGAQQVLETEAAKAFGN
ncbi:ABC transporter substrate-binding protein [Streptomyces sp. NPDC051940]|uniref:ABC transporter substrate-binding protein n=1 Tax=Streptomyces sp. NPDC051940 TaxID=3155675 RepID=UPI00344ADEAD